MDLILYHKGCPDGWCAAYIAHKKYPEAELLAWDQGTAPPYDLIIGKDVLSVDLRWKNRDVVEQAQKIAKSFTVIDHHTSGEGDLNGLPDYIFDVTRSGAGLTWDYLFGKDSNGEWTYDREEREGGVELGEPRPWWVDYIEDRDLWKWKLEYSREISAWMNLFSFTTEAWDGLATHTLEEHSEGIIDIGEALLQAEAKYVEEVTKHVTFGKLYGKKVAFVNAPYMHASELGAKLCRMREDTHIGIVYYDRPGERETYFSLRSDGTEDVSAIAKKFPGGGGHHNAGGFHIHIVDGHNLVLEMARAK